MQRRLHIVQALEKNRLVTGSVVQMAEAVRGLRERGHRLTVISRPGGDLDEVCAECGAEFRPLGLTSPIDLRSILDLRRFFKTSRIDVVHVHKGRPHAIALLAALRLGPRPPLVVNRGVIFPLTKTNRIKYRHPRVHAVVCVAEAVRRVVIESADLEPRMVHTIYSATDTARFDPDEISGAAVRQELGVAHNHLLVAQVSVRDWKGWRDLVAACSIIAPGQPELRLLLVGCASAADRRKVEEEAAAAGITNNLLTTGYRQDMPEVLAACDVVVDASTDGTGITGTIREAMAMARPVVATDCGGNRELVSDGENGILVPPGDPSAMADAISKLLWDQHLRRRLGPAARERVVDDFSIEQRIDKLEELYRRVAGL